MSDLERTTLVASALGIPAPRDRLQALFDTVPPALVEWSVNALDDPRAGLRVTSFSEDRAAVRAALSHFEAGPCLSVQLQLPDEGMEGVGLALSANAPPRVRWYRFAPVADGARLADAAALALPELLAAREQLHAACGSANLCTCLGMEADDAGAMRSTLYFHVTGARVAIALLEQIGVLPTLEANLFFKGLLGLDPARRRPWPKVWVGRSVGAAGGWKFYYFARGELDRPSDEVLLDAVAAGPPVRAAFRALSPERGPRVQLLGITFPDDGSNPRWTVYLADR